MRTSHFASPSASRYRCRVSLGVQERVRGTYADLLRVANREAALRKHARKGKQHAANIRIALETLAALSASADVS